MRLAANRAAVVAGTTAVLMCSALGLAQAEPEQNTTTTPLDLIAGGLQTGAGVANGFADALSGGSGSTGSE
ncbi:hypothetical protein OOZ19_06120 [Saccharopolyspora sp. NFXS83]|uniref:hypothetical protein n=1 Tax=Saccharopolyspora sp. NFXS83 TaxID=2993560 RepID=UPI00224B1ABD|nr:hypothetical protein [Saccharopolyspora sp. NFXS83]MCX2729807.1 hypothetical protein [Saccharopolyspora sp. NFXS83]